jgi:tetratricopeptide (TPR) repeat protein
MDFRKITYRTLLTAWLVFLLAGLLYAQGTDARIEKGKALIEQKKFAEAVIELSTVLAKDAKNREAARLRGIAYRNQQQYNLAMSDFSLAVELDPQKYDGYAGRAMTKRAMSDIPGAIADMKTAIKLAPSKEANRLLITMSNYYSDAGDAKGMLDTCLRAKQSEANAESLNCVGRAQLKLQEYDKAVKTFDELVATNASLPHAYRNRAKAYLELGQLSKARKDFDQAAKLRPDITSFADVKEDLARLDALQKGTLPKQDTRPKQDNQPKHRIYKLVKVEMPVEGRQEQFKNTNYKAHYVGTGLNAGYEVASEYNGQTSISHVRWSMPAEIVPGKPAKFRMEGSQTNQAIRTYAGIEMQAPWRVSPPRTLVGIRVHHNEKNEGVHILKDDFDLVLPSEVSRIPEEVIAGNEDRQLSIRFREDKAMSQIVRKWQGFLNTKTPGDVPIEETRHALKSWLKDEKAKKKEYYDLYFIIYYENSHYPMARYTYSCVEDAAGEDFEFQLDPPDRKDLRADGRDGILIKARVKQQPNTPSPSASATESIRFAGDGEGAAWADLSKTEMRGGWKVVYIKASHPDPVRQSGLKPPGALLIRAEGKDGDRKLGGVFLLKIAADPSIDAKPDVVEFLAKSGQSLLVAVWIDNAGKEPWTFRTEYAPKNRPLAKATLKPVEGSATTLTLQEAGLDPETGVTNNEVSVLRILAVQKGREPLERDIMVTVGQEGVYATTVGRDPDGNFYRVAADGTGKTTDVDFRVYLYDPKTKKLVNNKDAAGKLKIECLEPPTGIAMQALKAGQLKHTFAGTRAANDPTGIYRFSLAKEIPGDGRIIRADFKATYPGRNEENFTAIFTLDFVTTSNGPGSAAWQVELDRCREIIGKFVPPAYQSKMYALLDKRKMTLGADGLRLLREKIWRAAVELTLGEGGKGYADEAAWADRITVTLEWAEWAGDMAFGAVIGTWTGPYGAAGASILKGTVISAINAYSDGKSADEWLWENLSTIPGILEGKVIDVDTFEKMGVQNKAKVWAIFIGYHFCKNLYNGATVIDALKNTAREAGGNVLSSWLNSKVAQSAGKGVSVKTPDVAASEAAKRISDRTVTRDGIPYANRDDVLTVMQDPSKVRSLKTAPREVQQAFSNTREALYRQHDGEVVQHVKNTVPEMKYRMVKVMEFRTPGQDGASLNTDRDYRVCYYAGRDPRTGKESWVEVDRRQWEDYSYTAFARATGGPASNPAAAKRWAESHQQMATDKSHAEASGAFSDQAKVWNPQTRKFENAQIVPNIVRMKAGQPGVTLKDPQSLGQMYQMKVKDAKFKHEAFVQAQKAVKELDTVRKGYETQNLNVGRIPPSVRNGMEAVIEVNQKLAADPNRRDPKAIAEAEKVLQKNGFTDLNDFMNKLSSQYEALKTVGN